MTTTAPDRARPAQVAVSASPSGPSARWLWAPGTVLISCSAWFAWSLPATTSRRGRPSAALVDRLALWRWLFDHAAPPESPSVLAGYLIGITAMFFVAWISIVFLAWRHPGRPALRTVLVLVVMVTALSVAALPNKTSDVYDYALFGRVVSVHGGQAYDDVPADYPDDAIAPYASRQYTSRPDNKLPAWTVSAVLVTSATGDDAVTNLLTFRLLLGGANVATVLLIVRTLRYTRPALAPAGAALFGLNPIVIVYGPEKTDALMALLLVAGLTLVVGGRDHLATVAVTLSVLVKLITAPVLVLLVALPLARAGPRSLGPSQWPHRISPVLTRAAVATATAALVYGFFPDPLGLLRRQLQGADRSTLIPALHSLALGLFALGVAVVTAFAWRRPQPHWDRVQALLRSAALFLVAFSMFLTQPGLPWYLISALAAVALVPSVPTVVMIATLTATSFLMGTWDAVGTPDHPLPSLQVDRPLIYLAVVAIGVLISTASVVATRPHRRGDTSLTALTGPRRS